MHEDDLPPVRRPGWVDDAEAAMLHTAGWSKARIGRRYGVTGAAVSAALKRHAARTAPKEAPKPAPTVIRITRPRIEFVPTVRRQVGRGSFPATPAAAWDLVHGRGLLMSEAARRMGISLSEVGDLLATQRNVVEQAEQRALEAIECEFRTQRRLDYDRLRELKAEGHSYSAIARMVGCTPEAVSGALRREAARQAG